MTDNWKRPKLEELHEKLGIKVLQRKVMIFFGYDDEVKQLDREIAKLHKEIDKLMR